MDDVFTYLHNAGLKMKPRKCKLFGRETDYLGYVICADGAKVSPEKVAAVRDWPIPECCAELSTFLGIVSYYRKFAARFASIASSLYKLASENVKYEWTTAYHEAFDRLKQA
jgi:hypothetical protein